MPGRYPNGSASDPAEREDAQEDQGDQTLRQRFSRREAAAFGLIP
jgi:hypothetical protein